MTTTAENPVALERAGTAALDQQRFGAALKAFTQAAAAQPDNPNLSFGAGVAAFMLGRNDEAQSHFERALALKPAYLPAAMWLGDLHYRAGRLQEAIAIYEAAGERSPADRALQEQLAAWRKEHALQSRFHEVRTAHFTALFEAAADAPRARDVVGRLEAAYARVGSTLGIYPSRPIVVVIYTREQFHDITKLATWSVAAYDGRIRVPLGGAQEPRGDLDRVLSHEFVHAIVAMIGGRTVPAWMNEGLATVLSPAAEGDADTTLARADVRPDLATLHRSFVGLPRREAEIAYASSARAVQRLIDTRGAAAVVALLEDLGRGTPFDGAFRQRIGMRYEEFATQVARE